MTNSRECKCQTFIPSTNHLCEGCCECVMKELMDRVLQKRNLKILRKFLGKN